MQGPDENSLEKRPPPMRDPELNEDAFDTESMRGGSLFEYIEILRRRWVVVLIALIVVSVTGILFARNQRKMYASSASLAVSTQAASHGATGTAASMDIMSNLETLTGGSHNVETQAAILASPDTLAEAFNGEGWREKQAEERRRDENQDLYSEPAKKDDRAKEPPKAKAVLRQAESVKANKLASDVDQLGSDEDASPDDIENTGQAIVKTPRLGLSPREKLEGFGVERDGQQLPKWAFDLEQKKNVDVITVNVTSYKPKIAAKLADLIIQTYLDNDLQRNQQQAAQGANFVKEEMKDVKRKLRFASVRLAQFAKRTGIVEPTILVTAATKDLIEAEAELDKTRVAAKAEQFQVDALADQMRKLSPEIDVAHIIQTNPDYEQVRSRISALEGQISTLKQAFTADSPELQSVGKSLDAEKRNLARFSKDYIYSRTVARNPALDKVIDLYAQALGQKVVDEAKQNGIQSYVDRRRNEFKAIPEKGRQFAEFKEEVEKLLRTYDLLSARYYELLIEQQSSIPSGFFVSRAAVPLKPSFPNMTTAAALSVLLGILAGVIAAMILERLDTRIHDPALVERITGLTVLTAVPEVKQTAESGGRSLIIGSSDAPSGFAESFRLLRNNIAFSVPDTQLKIIAVTSAGKGDGKSTTSVNLAIAMAMDGNRVLLIDADLRRPALHKYLSLSREVGFTNVVRGNVSLENAVLPTAFDNVSCLPTGPLPPSPSEFLNSTQARALFERAVELYDFVIVDCPPCTGLSDIQVISTVVQGIVLVVALDVTEKQYLAGAIRLLNLAGAPVLGMVLNRVRYSRSNYYYYSYYYYYGYYGEDEVDEKKRKKGSRPPKDK